MEQGGGDNCGVDGGAGIAKSRERGAPTGRGETGVNMDGQDAQDGKKGGFHGGANREDVIF